jgi:hypothetical protein
MGSMVARCVWILWLATVASAELVRIELRERSDVLDGRAWGKAGPYERMAGRAFFEVDPDLPANRIIADIALAPRNARGRVEFSADLYILKPRDPRQGNGTLLVEISNRGNKYLLRQFNFARPSNDPRTAEHFGDGYLLEEGYTLVWVGWQFDVPDQPDLLRLFAPAARGAWGPITGLVRSEYVPDRPVREFSLGDRTMIAYPAADPDDPQATLTVRDRVEAPRKVIPRSEWRFAREEFGKLVPDPTRVWMKAGFQPGKIYEVVYRAKDPVVAGLGPAAVRDLVSYLKYGDAPEWALLSDQKRFLKRAIGIGTSQSGRFLRTFLYYGFNQDERGRQVFDGIIAHVAGGGRGSFNHRFAQPSRDGHPFMNQFYPTDIYPFADVELEDPETGLREGLLCAREPGGRCAEDFLYEFFLRVLRTRGVADAHDAGRKSGRGPAADHAHLPVRRHAAFACGLSAWSHGDAESGQPERLSLADARVAGGDAALGDRRRGTTAFAVSEDWARRAGSAQPVALPSPSRRDAARAHPQGVALGLRAGVSQRRDHRIRAAADRQGVPRARAAGG